MTEDNFTIRKASPADLPRIHGIYAAARQFMRDHGNFSQWDGEDAPERLLPGDIEAGNLYVLEEAGEIHAAFAFIIGADPCYAVIEQGEWKSDAPYAAVHRVASDGTLHNVIGRIMDFAKSNISHIRIDTHEHNKVMQKALEKQGFEVTYLDVDEWGSIRLDILEKAIRKDTILISVMYANNEVGTIQKIAQIGKIAEKNDILFHTDAVQAYGQLLIDVKKENIDLLSASAHKFNGPKGVGFLYIRKKIPLPEYIHGGKQERDHRAGTENVPGIAGMGKAAEIAFTTREYREKEIQQLRDYLIQRLQRGIPYCRLNGSLTNRLPGNCNISFQFIEGNELLLLLDEKNICASAASACSTGDTSPSHVLTAMGIPEKLARGTLRLTIGYQNTQEEIDYTVQCIKEAVEKLRENAEDYRRYKETFPCNIM